MSHLSLSRLLSGSILIASLLWMPSLQAQVQLPQVLKNTPQSRLQFSPYTVGSVISGAGNRVYVLSAQKGQQLRVDVHSTGARAFITVFDGAGKELATLTDRSQPFVYELPKTGNYYIFCYSGPTTHFYDFTVRVD